MYDENGSFEDKVKYIFYACSSHDDAFYLVKALYNVETRELLYNKSFLDTNSGKRARDVVFGVRD